MTLLQVNVGQIIRDVQRSAPHALSERFLRETWTGPHGRLGLEAVPDGWVSSLTLTPGGMEGRARMDGVVRTPRKEKVGAITRGVSLMSNGRLSVDHTYLSLRDSVHRSGFASAMNEAAYRSYEAAGVDDVTVHAQLSAGGYVWARRGFELLPVESAVDEAAAVLDRARQVRQLVSHAHAEGKITDAEHAQLSTRLLPSSNALAPDTLTGVRELAAIDGIGERVLMGQHWYGIREIEGGDAWWRAAASSPEAGQARLSAAELRASTSEPAGMADARRAVSALLPTPLVPGEIGSLVRAALADAHVSVEVDEAETVIGITGKQIWSGAHLTLRDADQKSLGGLDVALRASALTDGHIVSESSWHSRPSVLPAIDAALERAFTEAGVKNFGTPETTEPMGFL